MGARRWQPLRGSQFCFRGCTQETVLTGASTASALPRPFEIVELAHQRVCQTPFFGRESQTILPQILFFAFVFSILHSFLSFAGSLINAYSESILNIYKALYMLVFYLS